MTDHGRSAATSRELAGYPHLVLVLSPELASLPGAEIRALMEQRYGPGVAEQYDEYLEGIFGDIGRAFSSAARDVGRFAVKAAPVVAQVGGGALQGALAGAALGPVGMISGAALGGTAAALSKYGKGGVRDAGKLLQGVTGAAAQFSPLGRVGGAAGSVISSLAGGGGLRGVAGAAINAAGGALGGGVPSQIAGVLGNLVGGGRPNPGGGGTSGAALGALTNLFGGNAATTQLMSLLRRPETMQALAALSLGSAGRRSIPVGAAGTVVPVGAITNLIQELADEAAAEAALVHEGTEAELAYMSDEAGAFIGDPALDRDRALRLWDLLNVAQAERLVEALPFYTDQEATNEESADLGSETDETDYYETLALIDAEGSFDAAESDAYDYA